AGRCRPRRGRAPTVRRNARRRQIGRRQGLAGHAWRPFNIPLSGSKAGATLNLMSAYIPLTHRALIAISGEDRRAFLQGLVSADVDQASSSRALYGAFLTPQGKYLYDFFIAEQGETLL